MFYTAAEWRKRYPGSALILATNTGKQLILKINDELPVGKFRLLGII